MHAASRHGTPSLTSLPKDDEVSGEVMPDEDCITHLATSRPFANHKTEFLKIFQA